MRNSNQSLLMFTSAKNSSCIPSSKFFDQQHRCHWYLSVIKKGPLWIVPVLLSFPSEVLRVPSNAREFPLSDKLEDVVRMVYTHYKLPITKLHVVYTSTKCFAHDVKHYCFVRLVVHDTDASNVGPRFV